jgi:hypothetical protein
LDILYPVFPTVAIVLKSLLKDISAAIRSDLFGALRELVREGSHITRVPTNLAYAVGILVHDRSEETDALFVEVYNRTRTDMMTKRDIVLAMTARRADYWLSDVIRRFAVLTPWEKRALVPASYVLGDEGRHWRERMRGEMSKVDKRFMTWVGSKK